MRDASRWQKGQLKLVAMPDDYQSTYMDLSTLSNLVGGLCAVLAVWNIYRPIQAPKNGAESPKFTGDSRKDSERVAQFQKSIRTLSEKVDLLEEHAGEYFIVLNQNGWVTVIAILEGLDKVADVIDGLVANDKTRLAIEMIDWMDGGDPTAEIPTAMKHLSGVDSQILIKWPDTVNDIIMNVAMALQEAAEDTKKLGIDRKHKRKPTLVAVDELMRMLEKRHAKKDSIKEW